jgi:hypothetical protein
MVVCFKMPSAFIQGRLLSQRRAFCYAYGVCLDNEVCQRGGPSGRGTGLAFHHQRNEIQDRKRSQALPVCQLTTARHGTLTYPGPPCSPFPHPFPALGRVVCRQQ